MAKDRVVRLSKKALEQLRLYYKEYKPSEYLFEGQFGGQYSTRSIQALFWKALKVCGIMKKVTVHRFAKKSNMVPKQEIETAEKCKRDYYRRKEQ